MSDPIWSYYQNVVDAIIGKTPTAPTFQQQTTAYLGRLSDDLATAMQLLGRAYAILANFAVGAEPHGFGDLMVDIDDFREGISWGES